ncbi:pilus assembly protein TadG-related protein [Streptomyces sp. NPDC058330]|uniref:pilus assembly protein TadG-related protein n=1 Tax=Streptomyces sp. NPDC058330 TaxID=3346449 RepID=UPI0036EAB68B
MSSRTRRESGQAAPLYITAVAGLLFLALVFFAFGEADVKRNGAQSAADAAAIAAAQESRDQLGDDLRSNLLDGDYLRDVFGGNYLGTFNGCAQASRFAQRNDADEVACVMLNGRWGFRVDVESKKPMSTNVVPGTAGKRAEATAVAVVEPRCTFRPAEESGDPPSNDSDNETIAEKVSPGKLVCETREDWTIDPERLDLMPEMADLFTVRLAED